MGLLTARGSLAPGSRLFVRPRDIVGIPSAPRGVVWIIALDLC
jgi:hypothetical protein